MKTINIIGGGTFSHVRNHLSLAAPAFGETAITLTQLFNDKLPSIMKDDYKVCRFLTKMADPMHSGLVTNQDVSDLVDKLIAYNDSKIIVFNAALCDVDGEIGGIPSGKHAFRLHSRGYLPPINLTVADKIIGKIRKEHKEIFLVAFKTTCGATEDEQYIAGLNLLKENSCNLVLANDTVTRLNMIIVPEEARYCVTEERYTALDRLVEMTLARYNLHYTRSKIIEGSSIDWWDPQIPTSLRTVVDYCIAKGAYKPFRGSTAGHFAVKLDDTTFLTSKRSTDFNKLNEIGLVKIESTGRDNVIAHGAKPSVGGMSQRIIFEEHPGTDCIVHFHCPLRWFKQEFGGVIPIADQWPYECGSHECGENTSRNLKDMGDGIKAVYLDKHGPNIVFNHKVNPYKVIQFIEDNFDLNQKTGGFVS